MTSARRSSARHDAPGPRVEVVAVDAADEHGAAVDQQLRCPGSRRAGTRSAGSIRSTSEPSGASTEHQLRRAAPGTSADHGVTPGTRALQPDRARPRRAHDRLGLLPAGDVVRRRERACGVEAHEVDDPASGRTRRRPSRRGRRGGGGACGTDARTSAPPALRASPRPASRRPGGPALQPTVDLERRASRSCRPARARRRSRRSASYVGPVAYRNTERVMPPCHHWSWSSMNVASDHFTTVSAECALGPGRGALGQLELRGQVRVLADPDLRRRRASTISTLSAAPTWSTTRRPAHAAGTSNVRS